MQRNKMGGGVKVEEKIKIKKGMKKIYLERKKKKMHRKKII